VAATYISDADQTPATAASFTYPSFAVSGTNPVILVLTAVASVAGQTVTNVAVSAGLSGTPVAVIAFSNTVVSLTSYLSIWAIVAPSGTGTITVTLSASAAYQSNAILFQGADQTTPCPGADAVSAQGVTNPLSVTPANLTANDAAVGIGCNATDGDAPTWNQTQTFNNNGTAVNAAAGYHLGTGAVTVTWGTPSTTDTLVAVRVAAAAAAAAPVIRRLTQATPGLAPWAVRRK
jgi:hypothetical protein